MSSKCKTAMSAPMRPAGAASCRPRACPGAVDALRHNRQLALHAVMQALQAIAFPETLPHALP